MIFDVVAILLSIVVLLMTFKAEVICTKILKIEEPIEEQIMRVKISALIVAAALFIITIIR